MIKCRVEMWGLPREVSRRAEVEVKLNDKASLHDVIAALRIQVPEFIGVVIREDEDELEDTCVFNIDGQFIQEDQNPEVKDGERIRLLTLATGG